MALNLGLDGKVNALTNATDASEWNDALIDLLRASFLSDRNPFGALARQSLATLKIRPGVTIPWSGGSSAIPSGWLLCDGRYIPFLGNEDLRHARHRAEARPLRREHVQASRPAAQGRHRQREGPASGLRSPSGRTRRPATSAAASRSRSAPPRSPRTGICWREAPRGSSSSPSARTRTRSTSSPRPTGATGPGNFVARRDYLSNSTSATILDQADRHIHFLGGRTDRTGAASPAPITISGTRLVMHWIIKT